MSLKLPLYLHNHLNQAPGLALNAVAPYAQGIHYLKRKTTDFLHTCGNQLQNTFNVVYPILHHPRSSSISGILFSTRYMADLTGAAIQESYQKFKASAIRILNTRRQLLQTMASVITNQIINSSSSRLSRLALKRTIKQVCPSEFGMLAYTILQMNPPVGNQSLNNLFTPLLRPEPFHFYRFYYSQQTLIPALLRPAVPDL